MRITRVFVLVALVTCASLTGLALTKGPDAGGYSGTDDTVFSFVDLAGASGGVSVLADSDDRMALLTIPFAFRFYGQSYSMACVSSNGALYFVTAAAACDGFIDFANVDLSSAQTPKDLPALLPFWSDLTFDAPGAGSVMYQTLGTAGTRRFIVQWNNAYPQGAQNPVTFQAILSEDGSKILFQYKNVDLGSGSAARRGATATIGIRNGGAPANQQQVAWSYNAPVINDNSALSFSAAVVSTCAPNVSGSLSVTRLGYVYNPATQRFSQTVRLTNTSTTPITGPLALVLDNLSANATVFNASGKTSCTTPAGLPFVDVTVASLAPGATISVVLQFTNPAKTTISYNTRVLGNGSR